MPPSDLKEVPELRSSQVEPPTLNLNNVEVLDRLGTGLSKEDTEYYKDLLDRV